MSTGTPSSTSRRTVIAVRVALLAAAFGGAVAGLRIGREHAPVSMAPRFACPMHPDVRAAEPGPCPICGMDLEPLATGAAVIQRSTYLRFDLPRRRGSGPDAPAPAWVDVDGSVVAILTDDELVGLPPSARAIFYRPAEAGPGLPVAAVEGSVEAWDRGTSRVRFRRATDAAGASRGVDVQERPAAATGPAAGEVGRLRLVDRGRELPVVPASAVVQDVDGPYVMVASADGHALGKRRIETGKTFGGMTFVLSGLGPRDRVLTRGTFFVDAERKLRGGDGVEVDR